MEDCEFVFECDPDNTAAQRLKAQALGERFNATMFATVSFLPEDWNKGVKITPSDNADVTHAAEAACEVGRCKFNQVEPCVELGWLQRLKLKCDTPLLNFTCNFHLRPYNEAYERLLRLAEKDDPLVALAHYNIGAVHVYMMAYHLRLDGNITDDIVKSTLKAAKQQTKTNIHYYNPLYTLLYSYTLVCNENNIAPRLPLVYRPTGRRPC
jgi:hypothetical protein